MKTVISGFVIHLFLLVPFCIKAQQTEEKKINMYDPFAYKTAVDMYVVADTMPYSKTADLLIRDISGKIDQGFSIEHANIWTNLQKLEPYRMHPKVQAAVTIWVNKSVKKISNQSKKQITLGSLQSMSQAYRSRDFEKAVQHCINILQDNPKHRDIRSNMGLALMHLNKDLCAQIELEIVTQLSTHIPAMINLTVVYERMNRSSDAAKMNDRLMAHANSNQLKVPMIRFNAAWFAYQNKDYMIAGSILNSPGLPVDTTMEKYNMLWKLNNMQLK